MDEWKELYKPILIQEIPPLSESARQHAIEPRNMGKMRDPDGYAKIEGVCGDTMEIWIKMADDTISEISFTTDGCVSSRACGSSVTTLAKGMDLEAIFDLSPSDVLSQVDNIPEKHCATLAVSTLFRAVGDYMRKTGKVNKKI